MVSRLHPCRGDLLNTAETLFFKLKCLGAKYPYESKSGSIYIRLPNKKFIRISNHRQYHWVANVKWGLYYNTTGAMKAHEYRYEDGPQVIDQLATDVRKFYNKEKGGA